MGVDNSMIKTFINVGVVFAFASIAVSSHASLEIQVKPGLYINEVKKGQEIGLKSDETAIFYKLVINGFGYMAMTVTNCETPASGYIPTHQIQNGRALEVREQAAAFITPEPGDPVFAVIDYYCFNKAKFSKNAENQSAIESSRESSDRSRKECAFLARIARTGYRLNSSGTSIAIAKSSFERKAAPVIGAVMTSKALLAIEYAYFYATSESNALKSMYRKCAAENGLASQIGENELESLIDSIDKDQRNETFTLM